MAAALRSVGGGWWPALRAALVGCGFVFVMTAPTLTHPTSVGRLDTDDGLFSIWNIGWIGHALGSNPRGLFDANIFWPHTGTLAYSELNLVAGLLGWPWYAATGSALAALNGAVATALVLAFVCMWALVRRLTGSDAAGLAAAVAFTFCPYSSSVTPHVQLLMIFVIPLVLLAFHRFDQTPEIRKAVVLGGALAVAALSCGYYGVFCGCALAFLALWHARLDLRYWRGLAVAALTAGAVVAPVWVAFTVARGRSGATFDGHGGELAGWSANVTSYLASGAAAHEWWLPALLSWERWVDPLFPGIGVLVCAAVAIIALTERTGRAAHSLGRPRWRHPIAAYLALAAVAMWASFGPGAGLYPILNAIVPGMSLMRAPARFGIVVTAALVVVAGFGLARLERRARWLPVVIALVFAAELGVRTEQWGWPSWPLRPLPPVSEAYRVLADLPRGVVVEYPFPYDRQNYHHHAQAMFWSTFHWQPLVNGYSDVIPPDFDAIALPINAFPDAESFAIMRRHDVRYVLWHVDTYDANARTILEARFPPFSDALRPVVRTEREWLYEIVRWP